MYLVSLGILKDVDPAHTGNVFVEDVDFTFNSTELCFRWSGFNHPSSEMTFQLGVGSSIESDDIVPYETIDNSLTQYCFTVSAMTHLTVYYGLFIASTETGEVPQSSDGVRYINSEYELATAQIHDGPGCFNARITEETTPGQLSIGDSITNVVNLTIGRWYTFELVLTEDSDIPSTEQIDVDITLDGKSLNASHIYHPGDGKRHIYASTFATYPSGDLTIANNLDIAVTIENLLVKLCTFDVEFHNSITMYDSWWNFHFEDTITPYVTHYEVAIEEQSENGTSDIVAGFKSSQLDTHNKFTDLTLLPGHKYRTVVRACMQNICMPSLMSNGVQCLPDEPAIGDATAEIDFFYNEGTEANFTITIEWEPFIFLYEDNHDFLYIWTLSTSPMVANQITPWTTYEGPQDVDRISVIFMHYIKQVTP